MDASIILCTRNRLDQVIIFLESLIDQKEPAKELILVDSSDLPLDQLPQFQSVRQQASFPIVYVHSAPGLTIQRQRGIAEASAGILYFFDDDVVLEPTYLEIMNRTYREFPDYMGGMGTITNLPDTFISRIQVVYAKVFQLLHLNGSGRFYASGFPSFPHGHIRHLSDTEVLSGLQMSYRREVFEEFLFDEKLTDYSYMEDVDFSRRVSYKYRLFFNPAARLEHHHIYRSVDDSRERRKQYLYNHRYFFFKNFYHKNRLYLIAHWWSILGLFLYALAKPHSWILGYIDALLAFRRDKRELL